jgi:hypothetical protein
VLHFENSDGGTPREELGGEISDSQIEQSVDELILVANIAPLTQRACPFRIMCSASYPAIVR